MEVTKAVYISTVVNVDECPKGDYPEYAFIGRSNVGKSSLINMLTGNRSLAHTSQTPGKTKTINHFLINDAWYIADLPGYGYAKVSQYERTKWETMIRHYFTRRENLACVMVLFDIRVSPQKNDMDFIKWLGKNGIPFVIIFTKADKLTQREREINLKVYKDRILQEWEELPQLFLTSAEKKLGKNSVLEFIENVNQEYRENR
jgi:GTP-binding protein